MSSNRSSKLIKNTAILGLGTICTKGLMFFMTPLFTRWLLQETYGIFDLMLTYVTLIIPLITMGISEALFRYLVGDEEKNKKGIITNALVISVIGFIISAILIYIVSIFYEPIKNTALLFILLLFVEAAYNFMSTVLRGFKQLSNYSIANIIYSFSMVIMVTIFIKVFKLELTGIVLGYSLGYVVSIIYMILKSKVYNYIALKNFDRKLFFKMCKYAIPMIPNLIAWWIMDASDRTIVSLYLGASYNAILSVAHKIPNLCQTLFNVFHLSWQENAIETMNDEDRDIYYNSIMNNMLNILIPIACIVLSFNFLYFDILFDSRYINGYYQTPILMLSIIFAMLASFVGGIYIATLKSHKNGITTIIAAVLNIIIHVALISTIGLYAATISTLISYIVLFLIRYIDIRKQIKLKIQNKNIILFIILIYFVITQYLKINILNIINVILAFIVFIVYNKNTVYKFINKIKTMKK